MFILEKPEGLFYATTLSAGFDLPAREACELLPGQWRLVPTGVRIKEVHLPEKMKMGKEWISIVPEIQIRPRSGLAAKFGVTVLNAPSTIDADYRGEIFVTLINHSSQPFMIEKGSRIAQGVCALVMQIPDVAVKETIRGTGGFGSTGGI